MAGLAALTLAYFLSQFYRAFLAVLTPALTEELGATKADLSVASGIWFVAFAAMQFVVGVCLDRYGPRYTAALMLAIGGAGGAFVFAAANAPWMIVVAMALIGIGCSPLLMASVFIFARSYPPVRLAFLTSVLIGVGSLGNVVAASPLAAAAEAFGWREVTAGLGVLTLLVAAGMYLFVRDPARPEGAEADAGGFAGYLQLLRVRQLWLIVPLIAVNYLPSAGIRGLWAGPYLSDVYGADAIVIGHVTLVMALAMVAGSFIYGPMDTIFRTRKWVAVTGNAVALGALTTLALVPVPGLWASAALFAVIGMFGASYGILVAHGRTFLPPHLTGRGVTLLNFYSIGGAGVMQFVTGGVVSARFSPQEPATAYATLFLFYALLLAAALAIYLFSRDAKP